MPVFALPSSILEFGPLRISVVDAGLACCALEFHAMLERGLVEALPALADVAAPLNVLVVSGTVTDVLADAVVEAFEGLPEPRRAISVGACANSGGPYWDSYCVTKGIDQRIPVDLYVHGCPPRPEAIAEAIRELLETSHG